MHASSMRRLKKRFIPPRLCPTMPLCLLEHSDRCGGTAVTEGVYCNRVDGVGASRKIVGVPVVGDHGFGTGVAGAANGVDKNAVTVNLNRAQNHAACHLYLDLCQVRERCVIQWSNDRNSHIRNG